MQQRLKLSSIALLAANLAPLAGVVFLDWSVSAIIILYWFENIVIGIVNVARMITFAPDEASAEAVVGNARAQAISQALGQLNAGGMLHGIKLVLIPFFIFHYFFFCAGHGVFVFGMFADDTGYFSDTGGMNLLGTLGHAVEIFSTPLAFAAAALALSHVISFFTNYLGGGEYRRLDLMRLMMMPYRRIVVLHLTIIFGGFATLALGEPVWLVVILVLVKVGVDVRMHVTEHLRAAGAAGNDVASFAIRGRS